MVRNSLKFILALGLLSILTGCAKNKDVVVENQPKKASTKQADKKASQIATNTNGVPQEQVLEQDENNQKTSSDSFYNKTVSVVAGEKVVLDSIHFKFDDYKLDDKMLSIASENASKIEKAIAQDGNIKIKLEGNCDEWGTDEYNYALGLKRAKSVKKVLVKDGIDANKIVIVSYGESNPICSDHTMNCWKKNRRVDYKLLP